MQNKFKKQRKVNFKKVFAVGVTGLISIGAITGGIAGSINLSQKYETTNYFGTKTQSKVEIKLDDFKTSEQNLNILETTAKTSQKQYEQIGFSNINIQYGIKKSFNNISKKFETIGEIIYTFETNQQRLDAINLGIKTKENEKIAAKFQLLSLFNASNRLEIQNIKKLFSQESNQLIPNKEFQNSNWLTLNNDNNKIRIKDKIDRVKNETKRELQVDLESSGNELFDISFFNDEFAKNFNYNPSTSNSREEAIENYDKTNQPRKKPNDSWILWVNRDSLVQKINALILLAFAYNQKNVDHTSWSYVDHIYRGLDTNGEDKAFVDWVSKKSFIDSIITNESDNVVDPNKDPLLKLLRDFYQSSSHKATTLNSQTNRNDPITFKDNEMFYSWNVSKLSLVNGFLNVIDYANFYKFFKLEDGTNNKFKTRQLVIYDDYNQNVTSNFVALEKYYLPSNKTVSEFFNIENNDFAKGYYNLLNYSTVLHTKQKPVVINTLDIKSSILIGIAVLILIIAIIVSVLYKIPGLIYSILIAFGFVVQLLFTKAANQNFSEATYTALLVGILVPVLNLINFHRDVKWNIGYGYSYHNATKKALKTNLLGFGGIYLMMIFAALVFMYFNHNTISAFGYNFMLASFAFIITNFILFFAFLYAWLILSKYQPQFHLWRQELKAAQAINHNQFDFEIKQPKNAVDTILQNVFSKKLVYVSLILFAIIVIIIGITTMIIFKPDQNFEFATLYLVRLEDIDVELNKTIYSSLVKYDFNETHINVYFDAKHNDVLNQINSWMIANKITNTAILTNDTQRIYQDISNAIIAFVIISLIASVWVGIWLKWIAFIPVLINLVIGTLMIFAINGLVRIPFNEFSLLSIVASYMILLISTINLTLHFKIKHYFKKHYTNKQIKTEISHVLLDYIKIYNKIYILFILAMLLMLIFVSSDLLVFNGIIILATIFTHYLSITLIALVWFIAIKTYQHAKLKTLSIHQNPNNKFDVMDEQEITNINYF